MHTIFWLPDLSMTSLTAAWALSMSRQAMMTFAPVGSKAGQEGTMKAGRLTYGRVFMGKGRHLVTKHRRYFILGKVLYTFGKHNYSISVFK